MAAWLSNDGANGLLASIPLPSPMYAQLHTGNPGPNGLNNASGETSRSVVTVTVPASAGHTSNADPVVWPSLTGAVGETLTHISLWTGVSGGDCWGIAELDNPRTIATGDTLTVSDGNFSLSFTVWS